LFAHPIFSLSTKKFNNVFEKDDRAKKAAVFFRACEANPDTRLTIPAVMRAKGYSDVKAVD
jgi:hypothetical protein